jgi:ankyrin repeat protein
MTLLSLGADAKYEDVKYGVLGSCFRISPIHQALKADIVNIALVRLLLDSGANPNAKYQDSFVKVGYHYTLIMPVVRTQTPLHIAIDTKRSVDVVKLLLAHGADVNALQLEQGKNEFGKYEDSNQTALHILCRYWTPAYHEIIETLIKTSANVNIVGNRAVLELDTIGTSHIS